MSPLRARMQSLFRPLFLATLSVPLILGGSSISAQQGTQSSDQGQDSTQVQPDATAQTPDSVPVIDRVGLDDLGTRPFGVYDGTNENINLETGNLNLSIPLLSLPGRNGHNLDLRLVYDSNIYRVDRLNWVPIKPGLYQWKGSWAFLRKANEVDKGWNLNWPVLQGDGPRVLYPPGGGTIPSACIGTTTLTLGDGSRHVFRANLGCVIPGSPIQSQINVMDSEDPDGAQLNVQDFGAFVVTLRDGTKIYFPNLTDPYGTPATQVVDASGNIISYSNGVFTDTGGRQVQFSTSGITYSDVNGTTQAIQFNHGAHNVTLPVGLAGSAVMLNQGQTSAWGLLDSVVINSGSAQPQTYSFTYNTNGELTGIVYPHRGCTTYDYTQYLREFSEPVPASGQDPVFITVPGVSAKHVSPTGQCSNPAAYYTTTYTPTLGDVNNVQMAVKLPDGTTEKHYFTDASVGQVEQNHGVVAHETKVDTISVAGKMMKEVLTTWAGGHSWDLPTSVNTTFYDANGTAVSTTRKTMQYDSITALYEPYPYTGQGTAPYQPTPTSVTRSLNLPNLEIVYDYGAGTQFGALLNQKTTTYDFDTNSALLNSSARVFGKLTKSVLIGTASSPAFTTKYFYDQSTPAAASGSQHQTVPSGTPRGNLTEMDRCVDDTCATFLKTLYTYDDFGNLTKITDPKNNSTQFFWTDSWDTSNGGDMSSCMPSPGSFAYITKITNAKNQNVTAKYRPCTGARSQIFDLNNQQTSYAFDALGRVLSESLPDTGGTTITYDDTNRVITFNRKQDTQGHQITSSATYDGIGRITQHSRTAPEGAITVEYGYDGRDRKISETNPHIQQSSPTDGTTQFVLDGLSRTQQVTEQDGSILSTDYTQFPTVTVTDEVGKKRKTKIDGAGRLIQVIEDPSGSALESDYKYDAPGNLLCVEQHGGTTGTGCSSNPSNDTSSAWRIRRFTYDDASRLLTAKNPEGGTISYSYDNNGNVVTKTSGRGITTCFGDWSTSTCNSATGYDALNRPLKKTYTDGATPTVQFGYDGDTPPGCAPPTLTDSYPIGLRTSMCDGSGATSWNHDPMGRIFSTSRKTGAISQTQTSNYYLDGTVYSVNDGNGGSTIAYTPDIAGRMLSAVDGSGNNFVTSAQYAPFGGLTSMINGYSASFGGITSTNAYGTRLQPILLSAATPSATVFSECFDFHSKLSISQAGCSFSPSSSGDNGNPYQIVNNLNNSRTQSFTYDNLNRIATASSQAASGLYCWGQSFTIDAWGNLYRINNTKCMTGSLSTTATLKNQLSDYGYDAAGNLTSNGSASYVYDAEDRLWYTSGSTYLYDGDGQRVAKCATSGPSTTCPSGVTGTLYFRNTVGDTFMERDISGNLQNEYVFFNGSRVVRLDSTQHKHYYFHNHLMSTEVVTGDTGRVEMDVDYTPYGSVQDGTPTEKYLFTGKERDAESGLDDFGERYFGSSMGRFMTPDPGPWILSNPQSYNAYAYGLNNPVRYADDDGLTAQDRVNAANRLASQSIPYISGGGHPGNKNETCGLDCSGLVYSVFKSDPDNTLAIGGTAAGEEATLESSGDFSTNISDAQAGDAIFWTDPSGNVVHTGIVVDVRDGKVYFVHAPRPGKNVNKFYVKLSNPNLGNEKFKGVGRPREASSTQQTPGWARRNWNSVVQWWNSWSLFSSPTQSQSKPNLEPGAKRHKEVHCLKNRDGTCVN